MRFSRCSLINKGSGAHVSVVVCLVLGLAWCSAFLVQSSLKNTFLLLHILCLLPLQCSLHSFEAAARGTGASFCMSKDSAVEQLPCGSS